MKLLGRTNETIWDSIDSFLFLSRDWVSHRKPISKKYFLKMYQFFCKHSIFLIAWRNPMDGLNLSDDLVICLYGMKVDPSFRIKSKNIKPNTKKEYLSVYYRFLGLMPWFPWFYFGFYEFKVFFYRKPKKANGVSPITHFLEFFIHPVEF